MITLGKMVYISLDFPFFPLKFPPFLGIDHLENVSMRYQYPKVLGYRVLGIDIDPALPRPVSFEAVLSQTPKPSTHCIIILILITIDNPKRVKQNGERERERESEQKVGGKGEKRELERESKGA